MEHLNNPRQSHPVIERPNAPASRCGEECQRAARDSAHHDQRWELNQTELRYHHPGTGNLSTAADKGKVPVDQWVHIVWTIEPTQSTIVVDGETPTIFDRAKQLDPKSVTPAVVHAGLRNLRKIKGKADPKALPLIDALIDFVDTANAIETRKKPPQALDPKRQAVLDAMTKLNTDRALMEKMLREGV